MTTRAVIDTNVFIGALLGSTGENRAVLRACLTKKVDPLMGTDLFHEYLDVLARPDL